MTATLLDVAPRARPAVRRARLLEALDGTRERPVAVLVAPAGFGKTTLLREWCAQDPRPAAWLALDRRHEDPLALLRALARAVDQASAAARDGRIILVIDDVQTLRSAGARETLAGVARNLPDGMTIALASRAELPLPVARLRAEGLLTELRAAALAMTRAEAAALCRAYGPRADADSLDALMWRTEGWPAALALAAQAGGRAADGRDRPIADYLRDEVLAELGEDDRAFLLGSSILEALTGPLCDAVLDRSDSAAVLARLERSGVPLVALDRHGERYRHHRLLADLLQRELRRDAPELEHAAHRRASRWYAHAGERERAIRHALAAGDASRAGELLLTGIPESVERGASAMVEHWLSLFTHGQMTARPRLALAAAGTQLALGRGDLAEHWLRLAASAPAPARDRPAIAGGVAALRAALGRDGLEGMRAEAAAASALLAPDSVGQALCRFLEGVAGHLRGERGAARTALDAGAHGAAVRAPLLQALCLAQLGLLALDEHDAEEATQLVTRARAQIDRYALARYPVSALVLAASGLVRAQRGRAEDARRDAGLAAEALGHLADLAPWYAAEVESVLARTAWRLGDYLQARRRLAAAARLAPRIAGAPVLAEWLSATEADLAAYTRTTSPLRASLTPAELRVLQYLPTHLSFREIGERAQLSANTVKTQANTAYRKLDVRSRSDAVARARELGLLDAGMGDLTLPHRMTTGRP